MRQVVLCSNGTSSWTVTPFGVLAASSMRPSELSEQALDHLEAQVHPGLVDIEILRTGLLPGPNLHMQIVAARFSRHLDFAWPIGVGMLDGIGHKLVDQ